MKRKIKQLVAVVFTITFCVGVGIAHPCSDADKKALEAFDREWGDVVNAGDRAGMERIYADGYAGFGLLTTTDRKQAIDGAVTAAEQGNTGSQNQPQVSYDHYIISCTPNTGTITHRVVIKTMADGKESISYSRSVHFFVKNGGRWQVASSVGNPMNEAGNLIYKHISGSNAFMNRDTKWFEKNIADNYVAVTSTGKVFNKAQTIESIKTNKNQYESIRLSNVRVRLNGKMAVVVGFYHLKGKTADGKPIDMKLRFTRSFTKKHGNWLAVTEQTGPVTDN